MPALHLHPNPIANLFHLHRKHLTAADHRDIRATAMAVSTGIALPAFA
jgi:putative transposase